MNGSQAGPRAPGPGPGARGPGGLYVEESGTPGAPAIVFIHGGGQSGREWRGHMSKLGGFHCLAPDLPGHGRSNHLPSASPSEIADLVAELIETRVPTRRASVVGVSWGGAIIHALLDRHPDVVDRAIIDGSPPFLAPRGAGALMALFLTVLTPFLHTRPIMALFRETHDPADLRAASRRAFRRSIIDSFQRHGSDRGTVPGPARRRGEGEHDPVGGRRAGHPHAPRRGLVRARSRSLLAAQGTRPAHPDGGGLVQGAGAAVGAPARAGAVAAAVERLRAMDPENWYLRHKSRIMREVRFASRPYRKRVREHLREGGGEGCRHGHHATLRGPASRHPVHRR